MKYLYFIFYFEVCINGHRLCGILYIIFFISARFHHWQIKHFQIFEARLLCLRFRRFSAFAIFPGAFINHVIYMLDKQSNMTRNPSDSFTHTHTVTLTFKREKIHSQTRSTSSHSHSTHHTHTQKKKIYKTVRQY